LKQWFLKNYYNQIVFCAPHFSTVFNSKVGANR